MNLCLLDPTDGARGIDMGCYIHSQAEKQDGGRWVGLDVEAFEEQNYRFFGWLADVCNYSGVTPLAADRGFPTDASAEVASSSDIEA